MIDFPASPTVGQLFYASNSAAYQWNGVLWDAVGGVTSPSPGGDFMAVRTTSLLLTGTPTAMVLPTVMVGNSGGWYNASTGRYTPPAGRYQIIGSATTYNSGGTGGSAVMEIRKNGVKIASNYSTTVASNGQANSVETLVDANGTDYFEFYGSTSASVGDTNPIQFMAFPISGIKGPQGDPGQLGFRLLQRTDVSSAVPDVNIQGIASDINDLRFSFDLLPVTNAVDLALQFYNNAGVIDNTGPYAWSVWQLGHTAGANTSPTGNTSVSSTFTTGIGLSYFVAGVRISNAANQGITGSGSIMNIKNAARLKSAEFQCNYLDDAATNHRFMSGGGKRAVFGSITGFRLVFTLGNIASGAFSVWGSP